MANPKKKHTCMRTGMRRSANWRIEQVYLAKCANCGGTTTSHQICPECGFYKGQLIVPRKVKKKKDDEQSQK